jgi:NRPS condensation-like uncharacterized protein
MYQWSEMHPYNAVHSYRLPGPLDLPWLEQAIRDTYAYNGLGIVVVSPDGDSFHYETSDEVDVQVIDGGEDAAARLAEHLGRELNRPFPRSRYQPLRFTVITQGCEAHYVAITYDHWVADSVGIRMILRHVLGRYCNLEIPENDRPLDLYPRTYREVFGQHLRPWDVAAAAARSSFNITRNHSATLVPYSSITQMAVGFGLYEMIPGTVDRLRHFARAQDATVHDVILAALSRGVARSLPRRSLRKGGRQMVTGTIVDTRGDSSLDLTESVGTFLSYYQVRCRPDDHESLASLTRSIAATTRSLKAHRRYLDSLVNMQFIDQLWPRLGPATKPRFLRRAIPMTGGVSNVRLRDPWVEQCVSDHVFDYVRAAPTGPMLPVVLAPTTLGDRMNLSVTYRLTGFSQAKFEGLMESILDDLQQPDLAIAAKSRSAAA